MFGDVAKGVTFASVLGVGMAYILSSGDVAIGAVCAAVSVIAVTWFISIYNNSRAVSLKKSLSGEI